MSQTSDTSSQDTTPAKPGIFTLAKAAVASYLLQSPDVRYQVSNVTSSTWFSPVQPLSPLAQNPEQNAVGRRFDYMTGYNLNITPRADSAVSFGQLRQLADSYDILRLLIENKKDQLGQASWQIVPNDTIVPKEKQKEYKDDPRITELTTFFAKPDGKNSWRTWLRALMEDMLVCDAFTLYPRLTRGGKLLKLELMDGATIKPVIDAYGRAPDYPDVAYQQIIKGVPSADYNERELVYRPRNIRTNRVYGYSPVEQIIVTVNIALRRQLYQLEYYQSGSIPDTLFAMPDGWTPDQLAQFEVMWNSMLAGNLSSRRQAKFVPKDTKMMNAREAQLKDEYDEWLARVCCFAFSTNPQPFIKMMNRATAETMKETADEEGVAPYTVTIEDIMNGIIVDYFHYDDLVFKFKPLSELDPLKRAQADEIDIRVGLKSIDQVLTERNLEPIGMRNAVITPTQVILLQPFIDGEDAGATASNGFISAQAGSAGGNQAAPAPAKAPKGAQTANAEADKAIKMAQAAAKLGGKAGTVSKL